MGLGARFVFTETDPLFPPSLPLFLSLALRPGNAFRLGWMRIAWIITSNF
jgi:hypothetical protein